MPHGHVPRRTRPVWSTTPEHRLGRRGTGVLRGTANGKAGPPARRPVVPSPPLGDPAAESRSRRLSAGVPRRTWRGHGAGRPAHHQCRGPAVVCPCSCAGRVSTSSPGVRWGRGVHGAAWAGGPGLPVTDPRPRRARAQRHGDSSRRRVGGDEAQVRADDRAVGTGTWRRVGRRTGQPPSAFVCRRARRPAGAWSRALEFLREAGHFALPSQAYDPTPGSGDASGSIEDARTEVSRSYPADFRAVTPALSQASLLVRPAFAGAAFHVEPHTTPPGPQGSGRHAGRDGFTRRAR